MIASEDTACILLAAGQSRRFGNANKLHAPLKGKPLALHAAQTLGSIAFAQHIAVVNAETSELFARPFQIALNHAPECGMAQSIAIGIEAAREAQAKAVLIALADMPWVPRDHFQALLNALDGHGEIAAVATEYGGRAQVPAVFAMHVAVRLIGLGGDRGARDMLQSAKRVACDSDLLADFDSPQDFTQADRPRTPYSASEKKMKWRR